MGFGNDFDISSDTSEDDDQGAPPRGFDDAPPSPITPVNKPSAAGPLKKIKLEDPSQQAKPFSPATRVLPLGAAPKQGEQDQRKTKEVVRTGTNLYLDSAMKNKYRVVNDDHLEKLKPPKHKAKTPSPAFKKLVGKSGPTVKTPQGKEPTRPIYDSLQDLVEGSRSGDPDAQKQVLDFCDALDPSTEHGTANKELLGQYGMVRDFAVKGPAENRGTGNDEGNETSGLGMAVYRDSGLDPTHGVRPTDMGQHGQTVNRLQFHQYNRTPTKYLPLVGGVDHFHPGTSSKTSGKNDYNNLGNDELDERRMEAMMRQHGPASELGASLIAQVGQMKRPEDVVQQGNLTGFDTYGRDLATDDDAIQDLAFHSGHNREAMKRVARKIPEEFDCSEPEGLSQLSSDDDNFDIADTDVEGVLIDPTKFPQLYSSLHQPKPRPQGFNYVAKKKVVKPDDDQE